jgi:hypothetical protein
MVTTSTPAAIVWPDDDRTQERVVLRAASRADAIELLRQTYGRTCEFDLTDVEAANRPR